MECVFVCVPLGRVPTLWNCLAVQAMHTKPHYAPKKKKKKKASQIYERQFSYQNAFNFSFLCNGLSSFLCFPFYQKKKKQKIKFDSQIVMKWAGAYTGRFRKSIPFKFIRHEQCWITPAINLSSLILFVNKKKFGHRFEPDMLYDSLFKCLWMTA